MEEIPCSDLNLFEGMDGFEKFDPLDDSSLLAILDDLEEGTLLSLLGNETLVSDVAGEMSIDGKMDDFPVMVEPREQPYCSPFTSSDVLSRDILINGSSSSPAQMDTVSVLRKRSNKETSKHPLQETCQVSPLKRARLDTDQLLSCVRHDHSYATVSRHVTEGGVAKELRTLVGSSSSDEEGSLSDAGYDTMSSSTSPGNNSIVSSCPPVPTAATTGLPLMAKTDPAAFIDARIQHFMCRREVNLTEEEKETLKAEGLPIPTTLPLTKTEEKALRGVRRKLRNKMAAQESRKRKKEHFSLLEDKCKQYVGENHQLNRKVEALESENTTLKAEINKLQKLLGAQGNTGKTTRVGACLMVIVLCFAVFFGSPTSHNLWSRPPSAYSTSSVRSRSLLSLEDSSVLQTFASSWFRDIFIPQTPTQGEYTSSLPLSVSEYHPPLLQGPLSYYQHVYYQFSGLLNFSIPHGCSFSETAL